MIRFKNTYHECRVCSAYVYDMHPTATAVTCSDCVNEMLLALNPPTKKKLVGYPKGWRFMKVFVHADGTVYHRGVEQPSLKGTLDATVIAAKPKKSKQQKKEERQQALLEYNTLKKQLKKEKRKTYIKKIESKLKLS